MNTMKMCSGGQKPLEANAPDGLCPECLLKAGLGTGVDMGPESQGESGRTRERAWKAERVLGPLTVQVRLQRRLCLRGHWKWDVSLAPYASTGVSLGATSARLRRKYNLA